MKEKIIRLIFKEEEGKFGLNEKAIIFLFCLLLSTFFWLLASLSKTYTTSLTVQIECNSIDPNWIIKENAVNQLNVRVTGTGFSLIGEQLSLNQNVIKVDFDSPTDQNPNRFVLKANELKQDIADILDGQLRIDQLSPEILYFNAQKLSKKSLKVSTHINLDFKEGYQLRGDIVLNPPTIKVTGPQDELDKLSSINSKKIQWADLEDTVTGTIELNLDDLSPNIKVPIKNVEVLIPVEKFTEKRVKLKLNVASNEYDLLTFPDEVEVRVLVPLSKYESLVASSLNAAVDLSGIQNKEKKLEVVLKNKPDYIKLIRIDPAKVEYIIMK